MKRLTINQIMDMDPCPDYTREKVTELFSGKQELSLIEILNLDIPAEDRLWVILREDFLTANQLHLLACDFAEYSLLIWENQYPNDKRLRMAIETKRKWIAGDTTDEDLAAAWSAAESAAWSAWSAAESAESAAWSARSAWSAAESAAWSARSAAWSAAWSAAESAAWSAAESAELARSAESAAWSAAESAWSAAWLAFIDKIKNILSGDN